MYQLTLTTHKIVVLLFLLIYLVKTILLLANKKEQLSKFTKIFKVPEMVISFLFLATGLFMLTQGAALKTLMTIKLVAVLASIPLAIIGFKKSNKALAFVALVLIIGAYGLAEVRKKKLETPANNPGELTNGQTIYTQLCVRCHGEDGKAELMGASNLSLSQMDDAAISEIIINGKNTMPKFGDQLNKEQLASVVQHIKTLRK
ncbi:MAG: c-type cytochrome [Bacteroidia bacterium]|nr:c-type cytochrome [Bacteroidia bacterium]